MVILRPPGEGPGWSCHAEQKTDILTDDELERLVAATKGSRYENRRDAAVLCTTVSGDAVVAHGWQSCSRTRSP